MAIADKSVSPKDGHNYYIDFFRFIVMIWIVLFHYTVQYNVIVPDNGISFPWTFDNGGTVGVSLFFMVSGFFMTKALMSNEYGLREYGRFLVRRYLRLWVPYVFACIIIFSWLFILPVEGRTVKFATLLANIACIIHPGFDRVDNAHWFLEDLFIVQFLLGLVILFCVKKHRSLIIGIVFTIVMIAQIITPPVLSGLSKELFEVLLGVHLFLAAKEQKPVAIILTIIGLIVGAYLSVEFLIGALLFLLLLFLGEKYPPPSTSYKLRNIMQFTGSISFYWYLIHQNIGYSVLYYVLPKGTTCEFWVLVPMLITLLISLPILTIDKRLSKLLSERIIFLKK